ncbi:MAG: ribose 5-phosphate isomerase B [Solirubrobacteraceae bacterium]
MKVACGFDHAGVPLRDALFAVIESDGHEVLDYGTDTTVPIDYPDKALVVGRAVVSGEAERGLIVCGSGAGVSIAASKIRGVRAATVHDTYTAHQAVEHDNMNVLCLGGRVIGSELAAEVVRAFLGASFSGEERHVRRLAKVAEIERTGGWGD